jgi:hypothetical protein
MRVRDVITQSLDALVHAKLLPDYPPPMKVDVTQFGKGSPISSDMMRTIALSDRSHTFYRDPDALERAFLVVANFKASVAAKYPRPYPLPQCFGPLGAIGLADVHTHVEETLKSLGLEVSAHNAINHSGTFKLSEQTTVEKLPHFYGSALVDRLKREPWRDSVELRIVIDIKVAMAPSNAGKLERFASLELSAPAVSLVEQLQRRLETTLPHSPSASMTLIKQIEAQWRRRLA